MRWRAGRWRRWARLTRGTNKTLLITSGVGILSGVVVTEETPVPAESSNLRKISEMTANELIAQGVDVRAIRLPIVHGDNDHGFISLLINIAREKGYVAYVGDGQNTWAAVHRLDAARVYRLALDKGKAALRYHPVAEAGIAMKDLAEVIGQRCGLPVRSIMGDEVAGYFTWFSHFAQMNMKASSAITQAALGWKPIEIGMIEDLKTSTTYFR